MNLTLAYSQYRTSNLAARSIVMALVVAAHFAVLSVWQTQGNTPAVRANQLLVNFAMNAQTAPPERPAPPVRPAPPRKPQPSVPAPAPLPVAVQEAIAPAEQAAAIPPAVASTPVPVIADTEPDYKAAYLNNPPPVYPMVARRNGMQGRVMLNVEVLAGGLRGQINIHQSSGYAMLDNAALQTVRSWRFAPARHAGQMVDKWFIIPIQFSLKDNAA